MYPSGRSPCRGFLEHQQLVVDLGEAARQRHHHLVSRRRRRDWHICQGIPEQQQVVEGAADLVGGPGRDLAVDEGEGAGRAGPSTRSARRWQHDRRAAKLGDLLLGQETDQVGQVAAWGGRRGRPVPRLETSRRAAPRRRAGASMPLRTCPSVCWGRRRPEPRRPLPLEGCRAARSQ